MGHGQHGDHPIATLDLLAENMTCEIVVRPQCTIGEHHTFWEACSTAGVVDDSQLIRTLLFVILHMLLTEVLGELLAIEFVQMFAGIGQLVGTTDHQRIIGIVDDTFQCGHRLRVDNRSHMITYEQQAGFRMIHDVMNLFSVELMQDGNGNCTIGEGSKECYSPLWWIAATHCNLVAFLDATVFKKDVQFFYFPGNIMEL